MSQPIDIANAKAMRMDSHMGSPQVTESKAMIIPEKPIIDPTERSNSPAIIRRQAPTAMIIN